MKIRVRKGLLLLMLLSSACAAQAKINDHVRAAIEGKYAGRTVELRQSMYFGDLYDENERWLLSPYPFAQTYHINDLHDRPIHPQVERGIIAAATKFVVKKIEYPDFATMLGRMLTTPRYNTWVYLQVLPDQPGVPINAKTFVLVLPPDLSEEGTLDRAIADSLAAEGDVQAWLHTRRPSIRTAIENKMAVVGMTLEELTASMGHPMKWFVEQRDNKEARVAWYPGSKEAVFVGEQIVEVRNSRENK